MSLAERLSWQGRQGAGGAWLGTNCPPSHPLCVNVALQAQGYVLSLRQRGLGPGKRQALGSGPASGP